MSTSDPSNNGPLPARTDVGPSKNSFLDTLSETAIARLRPHLERVELFRARPIASRGETLEYAYFPINSVVSTLTYMADGSSVEVGLTGQDGLIGFTLPLGEKTSPHDIFVQIPGGGLRMSAAIFAREAAADEELRMRTLSYARYAFVAATQFAACNRLHPVEERFARWVLMVSDRMNADEFPLTQEFVAQMLGVRRGSVVVVAGTMSASGLIGYRRGALRILDRSALEEAACECYGVVNRELAEAMGYAVTGIL